MRVQKCAVAWAIGTGEGIAGAVEDEVILDSRLWA